MRPPVKSAITSANIPLLCDGFDTSLIQASRSRAELRKVYGEPVRTVARTEANRHVPGVTDSLFTVDYPGFSAEFRTPGGARDFISSVIVTDNQHIDTAPMRIGASEASIVAAFGEPTHRSRQALVYECGNEVERPVTLRLQEGVVDAISIGFYVD